MASSSSPTSATWESIPQYITSNTKPDQNMIEKFYNLVLEAQFVPPAVRENLSKKLTYEKKWETVIQYHSMMGNAQVTQNAQFGDSDRSLLDSLKNRRKRPDMTQLLNLKSRIGTCNKSWMESFIAENGITVLIKAMSSRLAKSPLGELDAAILYELICCIKTTINSGMTMKIFLNTENALRTVTYSLLFEWKPLALQVLEVLSVISDYSNEAASAIVQHLRHLSRLRREPAFDFFAQALLDADVDVKAAVLQLINSLLSGLDDLVDRMTLRNDLKSLKFNKLCELAVEDLDDELQTIKNTSIHSKRPSIAMPTRSAMVGRNSSIGNELLLPPDDVRFTRKLRMRAKHPSEANIKLFDETMEQEEIFADDGTPINPNQGIMMGTLEVPRSKLKTMMGFGNSTQPKSRYFILNGENLNSWLSDQDPAVAPPHSTINGVDILDIRPYSTNEELNAICDYTFEIITSKQVYPFGTISDDMKDYWIHALNIVRDRMLLKKCSYTLLSADLDSQEFIKASIMFKKQITVYEVISEEDYQQSITKSGVDVTNAISLTNFIYSELCTVGLESKLMELLQEIVVIPADSRFVEIFWGQLINTSRELKLIQKDEQSTSTTTATSASASSSSSQPPPPSLRATASASSAMSSPSSAPPPLSSTVSTKLTAMKSIRIDTELCKQLLTKKEKTVQGKATVDISKLTMELFTKNAEIERLSTELEVLRRSGAGKDHRSAKMKSNSVQSFQEIPTHHPAPPVDDDLGVTLKRKNPKPSSGKAVLSENEQYSPVKENYSSSPPPFPTSSPPPPPPPTPPPTTVHSVTFAPPPVPAPAHVIAAAGGGVGAGLDSNTPPPRPAKPPPKLSQIAGTQSSPVATVGSPTSAASGTSAAPPPLSQSQLQPPLPSSPPPPPPSSSSSSSEEKGTVKPPGKMQPSGALAALFQGKQEPSQSKPDTSSLLAALSKTPSAPPSASAPSAGTPSGGLAVPRSTKLIPIPPPLPGDAASFIQIGGANGAPPPLPGGSLKKKGGGGGDIPKSTHQPKRKMKGIFWNKVQTGPGSQCALWTGIDIKKIDDFKVDYESLEEAFSQAEEKTSPTKPTHSSMKPSSISLLDGKRTQNILISSGRVKMTPDAMVQLILALNPSELTLEVTEIMLTLAPTTEEYQNIKNYPNSAMLGKAEQILLALGTIPRLKERLDCHRITFHWNKTCDNIQGNLHLLSKTCHELSSKNSLTQLQTVMSVCVAVGNFLNGGSNRVATAVKLDSLIKFSSIKSNNQRGTLLHFVCRQVRLNYPEACEFYHHWSCVTTACDVSFIQLQQDFNGLKSDIVTIERELSALSSLSSSLPSSSHLNDVITLAQQRFLPFVNQANDLIKSLTESFRVMTSLLQDTASLFGESVKLTQLAEDGTDSSQKFFQMLSQISVIYRKTDEETKQWLSEEPKQLLTLKTQTSVDSQFGETNNDETTNEKYLEELRKKDTDENLFGRFRNQQEASADDMISQLKAKMKLKKLRAVE